MKFMGRTKFAIRSLCFIYIFTCIVLAFCYLISFNADPTCFIIAEDYNERYKDPEVLWKDNVYSPGERRTYTSVTDLNNSQELKDLMDLRYDLFLFAEEFAMYIWKERPQNIQMLSFEDFKMIFPRKNNLPLDQMYLSLTTDSVIVCQFNHFLDVVIHGEQHQDILYFIFEDVFLKILENHITWKKQMLYLDYHAYIEWKKNQLSFIDFLYFSFCSSTGTSFGDIIPNNKTIRFIVICQLLINLFLLGFLVAKLIEYFSLSLSEKKVTEKETFKVSPRLQNQYRKINQQWSRRKWY